MKAVAETGILRYYPFTLNYRNNLTVTDRIIKRSNDRMYTIDRN